MPALIALLLTAFVMRGPVTGVGPVAAEVEVPPEVAEVLEHSQMQDERTAARIAAAENAAQ